MRKQVIVKKGDRVWDSIKDTDEVAMFRVTEHMKGDHDLYVRDVADKVQWKLIFNKGTSEGTHVFTEHGFKVEVKDVGNQDAN